MKVIRIVWHSIVQLLLMLMLSDISHSATLIYEIALPASVTSTGKIECFNGHLFIETASEDMGLVCIDIATKQIEWTINSPVDAFIISSDGTSLFAVDYRSDRLLAVSISTGNILNEVTVDSPSQVLETGLGAVSLITVVGDGIIYVFDSSFNLVESITIPGAGRAEAVWDATETCLYKPQNSDNLVVSCDYLWSQGQFDYVIDTYDVGDAPVKCYSNGDLLAVACNGDDLVEFYSKSSGSLISTCQGLSATANAVVMDNYWICTGGVYGDEPDYSSSSGICVIDTQLMTSTVIEVTGGLVCTPADIGLSDMIAVLSRDKLSHSWKTMPNGRLRSVSQVIHGDLLIVRPSTATIESSIELDAGRGVTSCGYSQSTGLLFVSRGAGLKPPGQNFIEAYSVP